MESECELGLSLKVGALSIFKTKAKAALGFLGSGGSSSFFKHLPQVCERKALCPPFTTSNPHHTFEMYAQRLSDLPKGT